MNWSLFWTVASATFLMLLYLTYQLLWKDVLHRFNTVWVDDEIEALERLITFFAQTDQEKIVSFIVHRRKFYTYMRQLPEWEGKTQIFVDLCSFYRDWLKTNDFSKEKVESLINELQYWRN